MHYGLCAMHLCIMQPLCGFDIMRCRWLVETTPLNKISVPAFPDSRFLFPTQDFILRLMTHDSRTT